MKKKLLGMVLSAALAVSALSISQTEAKASVTNEATVITVDSVEEIAEKSIISCEAQLDNSSSVFKAYIPQDSIVQFDYSGAVPGGGDYWKFGLYANEAMTSEIWTDSEYSAGAVYEGDTCSFHLAKGTYYVVLSSKERVDTRCSITAVPTKKVFGLTANKNKLTLTNKLIGSNSVFLMQGKYSASSGSYPSKGGVDMFMGTSKIVSESGVYTAAFVLKSNPSDLSLGTLKPTKYNSVFVTTLVDIDKPIISGVKNNGSYKKAVVRFSDKHSGVKSAKLNGKSIKSGARVTKKGSYKLTVTDKHGNSKTVKFRVK